MIFSVLLAGCVQRKYPPMIPRLRYLDETSFAEVHETRIAVVPLLSTTPLLRILIPKRLLNSLGFCIVFRIVEFQAIALGEIRRNAGASLTSGSFVRLVG